MTSATPKILIADDQADILAALRLLLKGEGYDSESVMSPAALIKAIETQDFNLVLMDLNYARDTTSGQEGLELIARIRTLNPLLPVVVMTAWSTVELAVEAMRGGIGDFIQKPWENLRLLEILRLQILRGNQLREEKFRQEKRQQMQEREAAEARKIQQHLLPQTIPQIDGWKITGVWQPASAVSGDYYDVLKFDDTALGLAIADVTGKGMPAALLMANLQAVLKAFARADVAPEQLCEQVNRVICTNITEGKFITFFYGVLNASQQTFTYTNAGHNPPIVVHENGSITRLEQGGLVLGIFPDAAYQYDVIRLQAGDRLVLFTDGVTEINNYAEEEFGDQRLVDLIIEHRYLRAKEIEAKIMQTINIFSGGQFNDDATLIVVEVE